MKSWFLVCFALLATAGACGSRDSSTEADDRGEGGAGGGGDETTGSFGGGVSQYVESSCDELATCGDFGSGCVRCAIIHGCADAYDACKESSDCVGFSMCASECGDADTDCDQACIATNGDGAALFEALVLCTVCDQCPTACGEFSSICH
jgi:hypothetical protein